MGYGGLMLPTDVPGLLERVLNVLEPRPSVLPNWSQLVWTCRDLSELVGTCRNLSQLVWYPVALRAGPGVPIRI